MARNLNFDTDGSGAVDAADTYWNGGAGWLPLGDGSAGFTATFDGNGHTISNLFIDRDTTDDVGLFGVAGSAAALRNVALLAVDVTGRHRVGAVAGSMKSTSQLSGSRASGTVGGGDQVGGLVGAASGSIRESRFTGVVTGQDKVGGLAGALLGASVAHASNHTAGRVAADTRSADWRERSLGRPL